MPVSASAAATATAPATTVVKLRGVPEDADVAAVAAFFAGAEGASAVNPENVLLTRDPDGKFTGQAFVEFDTAAAAAAALGKDGSAIGERFVEVSASSRGGVEERHAAVDVKNREEKREPTRIRDRAPTDVHAPRRWYTTRSRGAATLVRAREEGRTSRHAALETLARPASSFVVAEPGRRSRQKSVASFWFASKTMR